MGRIMFLIGYVIGGLGEGFKFMSMHHYKKEIKEKLGFDAFPGTLNLKIENKGKQSLDKIDPIIIAGFEDKDQKYFGVRCYKARIKNIDGAIIIPDASKHENDIIEFIAPLKLRDELNLKDNDKVTIKLI